MFSVNFEAAVNSLEQQGSLLKLQNLKQKLAALPESSLNGIEVKEVLTELQQIFAELDSQPFVDKSRLANLRAFVGDRQMIDPMVRKVLLGLIGKLVDNPAAEAKAVTNLDELLGKIPGLKDALGSSGSTDNLLQLASRPESDQTISSVDQPKESSLAVKPPLVNESTIASVANEVAATTSSAQEVTTVGTDETKKTTVTENKGFDTQELLGFFLQEASEQVEKLTDGLLELERSGARVDLVNELFRNAHTLKGASGTMGYMSIVRITHLTEDVLDTLRQGQCAVSAELIDLLLNVTDRVRNIVSEIQEGGSGESDVSELVYKLEKFLGKPTSLPTEAEVLSQPEASILPIDLLHTPADGKVCEVCVHFVASVLMPSVRAVMVIRRLETLGKVIQTNPSPDELRQNNKLDFTILLATDKDHAAITKEVLQVAEIKDVSCHELATPDNNTEERIDQRAASSAAATVLSTHDGESANERIGVPEPVITQGKVFKDQTIRVPAGRLDDLLNLVGEMVISRTRLAALGNELKQTQPQAQSVGELNEATIYLGRLMNQLQESVMAMRMVPIGQVFSRFPRLMRELNRKTGKEADLILSGQETELDKTVIEAIGDPLMHIIRNSIDHGLETPAERKLAGKPPKGTVKLAAFQEGSHIVITVSDDGRGINLTRVKEKALSLGLIQPDENYGEEDLANLIFLPGFSTANQITDVSGRGVGMDVVKKALTNLGGLIEIQTEAGVGTTFVLRLPLTLAIIQALIVEVSRENYAIPLASVLETLRIASKDIKYIGGQPIIQLRGNTLPLISLRTYFELATTTDEQGPVYVVVVGFGEKRLGLIVDDLKGQQEIVIKSLGEVLANVHGLSGATIDGDGKVTLILDVGALISDTLVAIGGRGAK